MLHGEFLVAQEGRRPAAADRRPLPAAGAPVNPDGSVSVEALLMDRSKLAPAVLFDLRAADFEPRVLAVSSRWHDLDLDLHRTAARQVSWQREGELLRLGGIARPEFGIRKQTEAADLLFLPLFLLHRHDTLHGAVARRLVAQNADDHALLSRSALGAR